MSPRLTACTRRTGAAPCPDRGPDPVWRSAEGEHARAALLHTDRFVEIEQIDLDMTGEE